MKKYVFKRLLYIVIVFLVISVIMFSLFNLFPSDPARNQLEPLKMDMKPDEYEVRYQQLRESMGLNDPIIVRYGRWIGFLPEKNTTDWNGLLQGNLGFSQYHKLDCSEVMVEPLKNTLLFNIFSVVLTLAITIPLGIVCAVKNGDKLDQTVQTITILGYSIPQYIFALLFVFLFAVLLRWFPVNGAKTPGSNYVGMQAFLDKMYYMCLPIIVSIFGGLGGMSRYVRASMVDALSMDCIRTARAKGVREKIVIYSHAWRNALLPVVTSIIGWFLSVFSGSLVLENVFSLNGMGKLYILGLNNNDSELCLAIQMFYTIISLFGNLITDLVYGIVDPRVRVDK